MAIAKTSHSSGLIFGEQLIRAICVNSRLKIDPHPDFHPAR
jgi:hypothetical protein